MPVLQGAQGTLKSTVLRVLTGEEWFSDQLAEFGSKDACIQMEGRWLIEVAELGAMRRADVEGVKAALSRQINIIRPPYGVHATKRPRQGILVGTTNQFTYLPDRTGNRRFWPLTCGVIDAEAVGRDRDQLFAEAMVCYRRGEQWWLTPEQELLAQVEQEERREPDPWEERVRDYLKAQLKPEEGVRSSILLTVGWPSINALAHHAADLGIYMRNLGWTKRRAGRAKHVTWFPI